jgi:phosphoribosylformimino-5-aminoimidazole carboxamide ribotide isomerase
MLVDEQNRRCCMSEFIMYPAVDLKEGRVVRLAQGDPERETAYSREPGKVAQRWIAQGARWLHVVNLDGAFGRGARANLEGLRFVLESARRAGDVSVQFGGGVRTLEDVQEVLGMGVKRVILGTAAARDPDLVHRALNQFGPEAIAVGVDVRMGAVRVEGWTEGTDLDPMEYGERLKELGLIRVVYTDISRDGMEEGVNAAAARAFQDRTGLSVIAAGGVASLTDIRKAKDVGLAGVVTGRALYEGALDLSRALSLARGGV